MRGEEIRERGRRVEEERRDEGGGDKGEGLRRRGGMRGEKGCRR